MFSSMLLAASVGDQMDAAFHGLDMAVFQFFGSMQSDFLTTLAKIFTSIGSEKYVILFAVMGLVMCFFKRTRKVGFAIVFSVIIGTVITNLILKPMALRIRPYNTLQQDAQYWAWYLGAGQLCESDYSFPSGHTTAAFEVAISLMLVHISAGKKKVAWIFPVVAVLVGASRIYLMVHYSTDVFCGVIVGIIAGILGYLIACKVAKAIQKRRIDDIVDLERLFKKGIRPKTGAIIITAAWVVIFAFSFLTSMKDGGPDTIRCAYDREYNCQNEAQTDSKKYPSIDGKYYCKIHWKQLDQEFKENGSLNGN